ncbi:MAG: hypothetical protein WBG63_21055 [Phormidesmis sp.]
MVAGSLGKAQAITKAIIAVSRAIVRSRTLLPMLSSDCRSLMEKMFQQP